MRILIVDDEMVSRVKLETVMESIGVCESVDGGNAAVERYREVFGEEKGFDLVMLDIDMPDMQGEEVLRKIREIENYGPLRAAVVMVTAQSDQEHVLACLKSGCDEYIAKPFDAKIIKDKLVQLEVLSADDLSPEVPPEDDVKKSDEIFQEICEAVRSGMFKLPVQPLIGKEFRDLMTNNADLDEMAKLLRQDMTLTARLIQLANSALYRGYGTVQTIEQAIGRLGVSETEQMVTALSNHQLFDTEQKKYKAALSKLWQHSLASAYAAELLATTLGLDLGLDPFSAGLFHDIGILALLNIIAQMERRGRYDEAVDEAALQDTVSTYHAMFGAKLLEKWGFGDDYISATLSHNNLYTAESLTKELLVVHLANLVSKSLGYTSVGSAIDIDLMNSQSAGELHLSDEQIDAVTNGVKERMSNAAGVLT